MISYILTSSHERNKTATEHTALRDKCGKLPFNSSKVLHTFSINTGLHGLNTTDLQCWSLGCPRSLHRDTEEKKKSKKNRLLQRLLFAIGISRAISHASTKASIVQS